MPECVTHTTRLFISCWVTEKPCDAPGALHPKIWAGAAGTGRAGLGGAPTPPTHCSGAETGNLIIFPLLVAGSSWGRAAALCLCLFVLIYWSSRTYAGWGEANSNAASVGFSAFGLTVRGVWIS